jgi:hypothetical protein
MVDPVMYIPIYIYIYVYEIYENSSYIFLYMTHNHLFY